MNESNILYYNIIARSPTMKREVRCKHKDTITIAKRIFRAMGFRGDEINVTPVYKEKK